MTAVAPVVRHLRQGPALAVPTPSRGPFWSARSCFNRPPSVGVLPVFDQWMKRWPAPRHLADDVPGEAVRMWGRLGYPRRALRLHASASACVERFGGAVPSDVADLRSLPGVGEYTAAAVASFAFGQRYAVLDTNVRRVHARWLDGTEHPATSSVTSAERDRDSSCFRRNRVRPPMPPSASWSSVPCCAQPAHRNVPDARSPSSVPGDVPGIPRGTERRAAHSRGQERTVSAEDD